MTTNPKNQIVLTEDSLESHIGRDMVQIRYSDITSMVVGETKSGRTEYLRLESQNRPMQIAGYENMEALRKSLLELGKPVKIRRAVLRRPQTGIILFFLVSVPFGGLLSFLQSDLIRVALLGLLCLAIGLSLMILRPLSRRGVAFFRIWEWFVGGACILMPVFVVISLVTG